MPFVCVCVCLFVCLSVRLCVCQQNYCKSNQPISLKLGVMIELTGWKNRLTSGGDLVSGTHFGKLLHFSHRFGSFISISHTNTGRFSRKLEECPTPISYILAAIRQTLGSVSGFIPDRFWLTFRCSGWR